MSTADWQFENLGFDPLPGDPAAVLSAREQALALGRQLADEAERVRRLVRPEGWVGQAADAHAQQLEGLWRPMARYAGVQSDLAAVLGRYHDRFEEAKRGAWALEERAADARTRLAAETAPAATVPGATVLSTAESDLGAVLREAHGYQKRFDESVADLASEITRLGGIAPERPFYDKIMRWAVGLFRTAATTGDNPEPAYLAIALASFSMTKYATPEERARAVAAWASTLTAEQWELLIKNDPSLVGSTGGIPYEQRYKANRLCIEQALADTGSKLADARARGDQGAVERLSRRERTLRNLLFDESGHRTKRNFLLFDNTGDGRAAEVFGDLAQAEHVAICVPGMANNLDNFGRLAANTSRLRQEALHQRIGEETATIAWLGYDTPDMQTVLVDGEAKAGAPALREFSDGLLLRKEVTRTVVAHSYGSLVTGVALRQGLEVDNVAVIGSPGIGARNVADLHLPPGTDFWAGRAPFDPVALSEWHGSDPTDPRFGGHRFDTGPVSDKAFPMGHSSYFEPASESLENMAKIVTDQEHLVSTVAPTPLDRGNQSIDALQQDFGGTLERASAGLDHGQVWVDEHLVSVQGRIDQAQQRVGDAIERLSGGGVARDIMDAPVDATQHLMDAAHDASQELTDAGQEVAKEVVQAADAAVDTVQESVDKVGDIAGDGAESAERGIRKAARWLDDKLPG